MRTSKLLLFLLAFVVLSLLLLARPGGGATAEASERVSRSSAVSPKGLAAQQEPSQFVPAAPAAPSVIGVDFRVIIERVEAKSDFDGPCNFLWCDNADFFARVRIDTSTQESPHISNNNVIAPMWVIPHRVLMDDTIDDEIVTLTIGIWEADDFYNEQEADLTPFLNRSIELTVDVDRCITPGAAGAISGNLTGACWRTLVSQGTSGVNDARIEFRVEADHPPSAAELNLICIHEPIWPEEGEPLFIEATTASENMALQVSERIEIFFQNELVPRATCEDADTCIFQTVASGSSFTYGCRAQNGQHNVWTGWRRVQVGAPPAGERAVPILFTQSSSRALDIVFVPDGDNYPSASESDFQEDVRNAILNGFYGGDWLPWGFTDADRSPGETLYLDYQDHVNFWIAQDLGDTDGVSDDCFSADPPPNWGTDYTVADSGAILHRDFHRDCAYHSNRIYGAWVFDERILLHETMHSPFGLEDEYCCDSNYSEPSFLPNIYDSLEDCLADVPDLTLMDTAIGDTPRTTARCFEFVPGFWKSEPAEDDLMKDGGEYNGADLRRAWDMFDLFSATTSRSTADERQPSRIAGSPADPAPEFEYETSQKAVTLLVEYMDRTTVAPVDVAVLYGQLPLLVDGPPMIRLDLVDTAGRTFEQLHMWHPLLQLGTLEVDAPILTRTEPGMPASEWEHVLTPSAAAARDHGPAKWLQFGSATFVIPFSPQLATVIITDLELNRTIATVNVRDTIINFCRAHPQDAECRGVGQLSGLMFLPSAINR